MPFQLLRIPIGAVLRTPMGKLTYRRVVTGAPTAPRPTSEAESQAGWGCSSALGQYAAAGLTLRYRIGTAVCVVRLYAGGLDCVVRSRSATCNTNSSADRFNSAFNRLLGSG